LSGIEWRQHQELYYAGVRILKRILGDQYYFQKNSRKSGTKRARTLHYTKTTVLIMLSKYLNIFYFFTEAAATAAAERQKIRKAAMYQ
jgi:hypothetical protein